MYLTFHSIHPKLAFVVSHKQVLKLVQQVCCFYFD